MTIKEAHLLLNLPSEASTEEIIDTYEEAVFEQASFFMRRTFIPKLAAARVKRLENIESAGEALGVKNAEQGIISTGFETSSSKGLEDILRAYNQAETRMKLALANTSSARFAKEVYLSWIQLFDEYAKAFLAASDSQEKIDGVKLTDAPIFTEYQRATETEKEELVRQEFTRLSRLMSRD